MFSFRKSVHYGHRWPDRCVLGQLKCLFTLAIHDQIGSVVYWLFGGLFTLHCGHNMKSIINEKHLVFVKIYIANEIKIRQFILFNIKKCGLYVDFKRVYMNVEIIFFNRVYIFFSLFFFYSLFLINIVLLRLNKGRFLNKNIKLSLSIELNGYDLLLVSLHIA